MGTITDPTEVEAKKGDFINFDWNQNTFKGPLNLELIPHSSLKIPLNILEKLVDDNTDPSTQTPVFKHFYWKLAKIFNDMVEPNQPESPHLKEGVYHFKKGQFQTIKKLISDVIPELEDGQVKEGLGELIPLLDNIKEVKEDF